MKKMRKKWYIEALIETASFWENRAKSGVVSGFGALVCTREVTGAPGPGKSWKMTLLVIAWVETHAVPAHTGKSAQQPDFQPDQNKTKWPSNISYDIPLQMYRSLRSTPFYKKRFRCL